MTAHPKPPPTSLPTTSASSPTATLGAPSQPSVPFNHGSKAEQPLAPITRHYPLLLSSDLISDSAPSNQQSDRCLFFLPTATTAVAMQPQPSPSIVALSLGHLLPCSQPALNNHTSAPPSFTVALNPQAYMGTFFHYICSNCCSSPLTTSATAKRLLVAATAVTLAPAAASLQRRLSLLPNRSSNSTPAVASQLHSLIPSTTGSSFSEAPSPGSLP
ncbi:hypothetical protein B296_00006166 [Ensete ventricosum]|uniref:Uncharacterized protein n=1 Tax=Ensete ventricosum TaxID=4639 RepID=A0A427AD45_ENSVE|nr:hypothetical protein B296_00006166 [Ensete ventricosum]